MAESFLSLLVRPSERLLPPDAGVFALMFAIAAVSLGRPGSGDVSL